MNLLGPLPLDAWESHVNWGGSVAHYPNKSKQEREPLLGLGGKTERERSDEKRKGLYI